MPVIHKSRQEFIVKELETRYKELFDLLQQTPLRGSGDGLTKGRMYINPDDYCRLKGTSDKLKLAADDFLNILKAIKGLK